MALVKCEECGHEISENVRICPNCGHEKNFIFCGECGKKLSSNAFVCPECGYPINTNAFLKVNTEDDKHGIALAGLICSFLIPVIGLILGIIVINANKGKSNSSKTMGIIAIIVSSLCMVISFFLWMSYFSMLFNIYW